MDYKINKRNSPNKSSRQNWKPDMIVSHITEGNYGGAIEWLCNPASQASAHFVVSRKGEITQLVDIREMAWVNGTSINPNKSNFFGNSSLQLVRDRRTNANLYTIGIEHEGFSNNGQGKLTDEQFKATVWLHKYILAEVKRIYGIDIKIDRNHIVGHYQIDPRRKPNCPGRNFQWDMLINELKQSQVKEKVVEAMSKYFKDVPASHWGSESLDRNFERKIINGSSNGNFRPSDNITRIEVSAIADRIVEYLLKELKK